MEKIKKLKEEIIATLKYKNNHKAIIQAINNGDDFACWLKEKCKSELFEDSLLETDLVELSTDKEKPSDSDLENAIKIYEMMSRFSDAETCNENLWMGLTFGKYIDYMKYRWPIEKESTYVTHWIFPYDSKRSLFFNGLSRLYMYAKFSYDESLDDPYELTKFCFEDVNTFNELVYRSYSNSKDVRLALIKALKMYKENFGKLGMDLIRYGAKSVSFFGGTYLLDSFTQDELKEKIYNKLVNFKDNSDNIQVDNKFKL